MLFKNRNQIINNGQTPELKRIRSEILDIFTAAIEAVDPYKSVISRFQKNIINLYSNKLKVSDFDNVYLIGFGKASIGMAKAVCDSIKIKNGIVITNDSNYKPIDDNIKVIVAHHPIPEQINITAADEIINVVKNCSKKDLLIVLISGGGSALLCKPRVDLKDLQKTTNLLLNCGANINEINTVRKHISFVKGGQLAILAKCMVVSFIISDIIGDPIQFISSGPTSPDSTTFKDALNVLQKHNIWNKIPLSVVKVIEKGIKGTIPETPEINHPVFKNVENMIVANNEMACKAAEKKAILLGYNTLILTTSLDGEAKNIGLYLVKKAVDYKSNLKKMLFITGGETTVRIKGTGKGGRNQEMVLGCVKELANKNIVFSSFATDGIDGICDAAGAIVDSYTFKRAEEKNLDPIFFLKNNNSYEFFKELGDGFNTGPTGTNVMDIQLLIKIK